MTSSPPTLVLDILGLHVANEAYVTPIPCTGTDKGGARKECGDGQVALQTAPSQTGGLLHIMTSRNTRHFAQPSSAATCSIFFDNRSSNRRIDTPNRLPPPPPCNNACLECHAAFDMVALARRPECRLLPPTRPAIVASVAMRRVRCRRARKCRPPMI